MKVEWGEAGATNAKSPNAEILGEEGELIRLEEWSPRASDREVSCTGDGTWI